jgi:hypothetical protein
LHSTSDFYLQYTKGSPKGRVKPAPLEGLERNLDNLKDAQDKNAPTTPGTTTSLHKNGKTTPGKSDPPAKKSVQRFNCFDRELFTNEVLYFSYDAQEEDIMDVMTLVIEQLQAGRAQVIEIFKMLLLVIEQLQAGRAQVIEILKRK